MNFTKERLQVLIQACHLNFLVGSGLSMPFLPTLGNIESLLTQTYKDDSLSDARKTIIEASLFSKYFESVVYPCKDILSPNLTNTELIRTKTNYRLFVKTLHNILLRRKSTIIHKQANIFTTNIDLFWEKALEEMQIEFNDGFSGRLNPIFSLTNFNKLYYKRSLHYDNISEMPAINLLKVHGSLSWQLRTDDKIEQSKLEYLDEIEDTRCNLQDNIIPIENDALYDEIKRISAGMGVSISHQQFLKKARKLPIVNPTKAKFKETVLDLNYAEMLRIFANELEKENTLLFVMGFSVADEHIREILLRAANSNPTLLIIIYCFDSHAEDEIRKNINSSGVAIRNSNIFYESPPEPDNFDFETIHTHTFKELTKDLANDD